MQRQMKVGIAMSVRKINLLVFVTSIWILLTIDDINANIVETPADTEVRVGDATYLNCSISDASGEISWYHYPLGKGAHDLRYVYANRQVFEPYNRRFLIEKTPPTGSFNLVITKAEVQDAGSYVCEDGRKAATSQLIILESNLDCKSNINSSGFIGPNVCGLQKETIQLSCAINYTGNIAPMLQWTRVRQGNWFTVPGSCSVFDGRITCNYTTEADTQLDESVFICHSNRSRKPKENCQTEAVKILYAFATDNQIEKTVGETVTCVANTNSVCSNYVWFYSDGVHPSVASTNQSLSLENAGWYRCEANCSIKNQQCSYNTMTVNVDTKPQNSHYHAIIAALCCIIVIAAALIILFKTVNKRRRRENPSWPKTHAQINPFNEHLLKCQTDPLVYIKKPKLMQKFNMKASGNKEKAIHGITVLKGKLYVVRDCCPEIEVYSMKDCKHRPKDSVKVDSHEEIEVYSKIEYKYKDSVKVEKMVCPYDIISHDAKNYLFIDDNKGDENDQNEIIRVTPKEDVGKACRWLIGPTDGTKVRIGIGRFSMTHEENILIPLMTEFRLREYDCDGNLKREIVILTPDKTYEHFRQAILLRSGYFVLSFGDGAKREKQGVLIAKMEDQKLKCIQNDSHSKEQKDIAKSEDRPSNKGNKNEHSGSNVEINIPSHTITLDDKSILVADRENRRVLLFHVETKSDGSDTSDTSEAVPRLTFQRELLSKKNGLNKPYRLYLDTRRGHLFVSDNEAAGVDAKEKAKHGRILVYSVC